MHLKYSNNRRVNVEGFMVKNGIFATLKQTPMAHIFIYFIAGLFLSLLFLNLFFRWKVIRVYKNLIKNRVEFNSVDIFRSQKKMNSIYQRYPDSKQDIMDFMYYIRLSVGMAVLIILLITLLGLILHYNE